MILKCKMNDCNKCAWIFNSNQFYQHIIGDEIVIRYGKNKIETIKYTGDLYCKNCKAYVGPNNNAFIIKYPEVVICCLKKYLVKDVVGEIMKYYDLL